MSANWQHCHPILTTELTHLDNIPVVAAGRGKRQDAHVRNSVLFGPVQLQVVRQANVAVVGSVASCEKERKMSENAA